LKELQRNLALAGGAALVGYGLYKLLCGSDDGPQGGSAAKEKSKADDADDGETVCIFFGSQTGTAQGFAEDLAKEISARGPATKVIDLEDFEDESDLQGKALLVFVLATYGEGDPTDNAMAFDKWIQEQDEGGQVLSGARFAVMGLGNRQYVHFNGMSRRVDGLLEKLGASRVCQAGEGDDDADIDEDFSQWKEGHFFPALEGLQLPGWSGAEVGELTQEQVLQDLPLVAEVGEAASLPIDASVQGQGVDVVSKGYFAVPCKVLKVQELRQQPGPEKSTVQVDFELSGGLTYEAADTADILPDNAPELVDYFAARLGVGADDHVSLVKNPQSEAVSVKKLLPCPCPARLALARYCDLSRVPGKSVLQKFACFLNAEGKENLTKLLQSPAYKLVNTDEVHLSFAEFTHLFLGSLEMDLGVFLQLCPRQKPRSFTISSSRLETPGQLSVTCGLVSDEKKSLEPFFAALRDAQVGYETSALPVQPCGRSSAGSQRLFRGITSDFLCHRIEGREAIVSVHKSTFRLPQDLSKPIIMIGAGTGVAPFRAFLRELQIAQRPAETLLIFGCQYRDQDYIYRSEFEELQNKGVLNHLVCAFSREQAHKVYVQHKVKDQAELIKKLFVEQQGTVYICGGTGMGKSVLAALEPIIGNIEQHRTSRRIIEELWG